MLETEAMTKICPYLSAQVTESLGHAKMPSHEITYYPGDTTHIQLYHCSTVQCMAWAWIDPEKTRGVCLRLSNGQHEGE